MIKVLFKALTVLFVSIPALAVIDMKNSNYSDAWTDITVPGSGYELRIKRTYNSRSLFNGMFGFGWCSDYETTLNVTAESGLRITECGGGLQVTYTLSNYKPGQLNKTIEKIAKEVKKRNKSMSNKELLKLKKDLVNDQYLRIALVKRLNLKGKVKEGKIYRANGREAEYIKLKDNHYVRHMTDGTFQKFNQKGQLTHMYDKNGNYIKINYKKEKIVKVTDNSGRQLNFTYTSGDRRLDSITGPSGLRAKYKFKGDDLVSAVNQWKVAFKYKYDDLHNLTRIDFADKTFKKLTYDKDRDWIMSFTNRKGCVEKYNYIIDKKAKHDHYWSKIIKRCGKKVTNKSAYEFVYKGRPDGEGSFLQRVKSDVNGEKTDVTYHPLFGKPTRLTKNGLTTIYKYYDNGFVKRKSEPYRSFAYKYNNKCNKVSQVVTKYFAIKGKVKKSTKTAKSNFYYNGTKCNLKRAKNSDGQLVLLSYDTRGRISKIVDQNKKMVNIKYENRFGKPKTVHRPGLGTLHVKYKSSGEIDKVDSKQGPTVAVQVANVFNNLLELISPATSDLSL